MSSVCAVPHCGITMVDNGLTLNHPKMKQSLPFINETIAYARAPIFFVVKISMLVERIENGKSHWYG